MKITDTFPRRRWILTGCLWAGLSASVAAGSNLALVGHWPEYRRAAAYAMAVEGDYAYVAAGDFQVIDVRDPNAPQRVGWCACDPLSNAIAIAGDYAYVTGKKRILIVDIADPRNPRPVASYGEPSWFGVSGLAVVGDRVCVSVTATNGMASFRILDAKTPTQLAPLGECSASAGGIWVDGPRAYVLSAERQMKTLDLRDPAKPATLGTWVNPAGGRNYGLAVSGDYAYVGTEGRELAIVDVRDPARPMTVGRAALSIECTAGVALYGQWAVAMGGGRLVAVDVAQPEAPRVVAELPVQMDAFATRVAVQDRYAYVAMNGLVVVDIAEPRFPQLLGTAFNGSTREVVVEGDYAYVAEGRDGLQILDLKNPAAPRRVGAFVPAGVINGVAIRGTTAFLANSGWGLQALDVSDPQQPRWVGENTESGTAGCLALAAHRAYVCADRGLDVFDVSQPESMERIGRDFAAGSPEQVRLAGDTAVTLCTVGREASSGLRIYDVRDPASLQLLGEHALAEMASGMDVAGGYGYAGLTFSARLEIVDLRNPREPETVAFEPVPGLHGISGLRASGKLLYVCGGGTLEVLDLSNPTHPARVSQYQDSDLIDAFRSVTVQGDRVFLSAGDAGLFILKSSAPSPGFVPGALRMDGAGAHLFFRGQSGQTLFLERSQDLNAWQPWLTRVATGETEEAVDSGHPSVSRMFYRLSAP